MYVVKYLSRSLVTIMAKAKKKKFRIPWIPFLYKPKYQLSLPEIDLSESSVRLKIFIFSVIVCAVAFGGIVYLIVQPTPALLSSGGRPQVLYPSLDRQTLVEGIVASVMFLFSVVGVFLLRKSTEIITEEESRGIWIYLGMFLFLIGALGLTYIFYQKYELYKTSRGVIRVLKNILR